MKIALTAVAAAALWWSAYGHAQTASALAWENEATSVSAELTKAIDSKGAKAGQEVAANTTTDARLDDGTMLPKGSRLLGHVLQVQTRSSSSPDARLVLRFDRAMLSDGRLVAVQAMMQSMVVTTVAARSPALSPMPGADGMDASTPAGGRGVGRNGDDGLGGITRGTAGSGLPPSSPTGPDVPAGPLPGGSQPVAQAGANTANPMPTGRAFPVGNLAGVTFTNAEAPVNGAGAASAVVVLSGEGRNFSLERGTRMNLSLLAQSQ